MAIENNDVFRDIFEVVMMENKRTDKSLLNKNKNGTYQKDLIEATFCGFVMGYEIGFEMGVYTINK